MLLREALFQTSWGRRHGIVLPPVQLDPTPADVPGLINVAVAVLPDDPMSPASGGIARSAADARNAAVGESLERYSASLFPLPLRKRNEVDDSPVYALEDFSLFTEEQRTRPGFDMADAYANERMYVDAYDLSDNSPCWVPSPLMTLERKYFSIATSSGVAAAPTVMQALLRATQELVERDAFMTTWVHEIPARQVQLAKSYTDPVAERGGSVVAFDVTPTYSSHAIAMVMGMIPRLGVPRYSLGAAGRKTWDDAVEKAYIEWGQGITFVGDRLARGMMPSFESADDVRDFDHHALYYSTEPELWERLPIFNGQTVEPPKLPTHADDQLEDLVIGLKAAGIRLFYRDITTVDLRQIGMRAVRVISPDLVPVHHDHRFPHLDGTAPDAKRRYPWWSGSGNFPTSYPHPLG